MQVAVLEHADGAGVEAIEAAHVVDALFELGHGLVDSVKQLVDDVNYCLQAAAWVQL